MFIENKNGKIYTVDFGTEPRTLLAHGGWIGSWELWTEPFMELCKTWRAVAYDHRGTGATIAPVESITMDNMVGDLLSVMDARKIEKCVLAAESAGGMVAVSAALQHPERFEGLVLVDALLHNEDHGVETPFVQGLKKAYSQTIAKFVDNCVLESEPGSREIRSWGRKILSRATPEAAVRLIEYSYGIDLRPKLSQIKVPTLIIHGNSDQIVPFSEAEYAASQISNCHLHVMHGAGHVPTMTRPMEVANEINKFFGNKL